VFVTPGIDHQEKEDENTQDKEYHCPRLLFPQDLETLEDLLEVHPP
jgi:hypothetical protein